MPIKLMTITLFLRLLLGVSGILLLINVLFLYSVANPTAGFALQAILAISLIGYALFMNRIPQKIHLAAIILLLIPFIFSLFLAIYGNRHNVDYSEDVVIVLGAGVNGINVSRPLAHRLHAAADYWFENPGAIIVVTGGLGNRATITEAEAMARFLIQRREIPEEVILLEDLSTSTYENLAFAKEILEKHFPDGFSTVLISSDFHMYRAVRTAGAVGLEVNSIGAYTDWYTWPANYLREILAVINFKLFTN